jgi:hypothetical protein
MKIKEGRQGWDVKKSMKVGIVKTKKNNWREVLGDYKKNKIKLFLFFQNFY